MLAFLIAKPDDWATYVEALAKELKEGKDAISRTLNELIARGYCLRSQMRGENKQFGGYTYLIFESLTERKNYNEEQEQKRLERMQTELQIVS